WVAAKTATENVTGGVGEELPPYFCRVYGGSVHLFLAEQFSRTPFPCSTAVKTVRHLSLSINRGDEAIECNKWQNSALQFAVARELEIEFQAFGGCRSGLKAVEISPSCLLC
ncbi:hypothetical protein HAX54_051801, partial [Datura stramonium]|nr:hypothetical protein [Datura stramonium]